MKSYIFKVVLEKDKWPDEPDSAAVWRAYIPALEAKGAASWGETQEEALENLKDALDLVVAHMRAVGESLPQEPSPLVRTSDELMLTVNA